MDASAKEMSEKLVQEANVTGAYAAFRSLRPMAFRADLWRYMALWDLGGVYLDHKLVVDAPITKWLDRSRDSIHTSSDQIVSALDPDGPVYWNAVIASKPRDPGMLQAIKDAVSHIQDK